MTCGPHLRRSFVLSSLSPVACRPYSTPTTWLLFARLPAGRPRARLVDADAVALGRYKSVTMRATVPCWLALDSAMSLLYQYKTRQRAYMPSVPHEWASLSDSRRGYTHQRPLCILGPWPMIGQAR
jgi:hypothetical protein